MVEARSDAWTATNADVIRCWPSAPYRVKVVPHLRFLAGDVLQGRMEEAQMLLQPLSEMRIEEHGSAS